MSLGFSQIIGSIEAEIKSEYLGGAIRWCDDHFDSAWSKAIDKFETALVGAIERSDFRSAEIAGAHYKRTVLDLLAKYKSHKGIADAESFLASLEAQAVD